MVSIDLILISAAFYLVVVILKLVYKAIKTRRALQSQGIRGTRYRFLKGNNHDISTMKEDSISASMEFLSHDIFQRIFPHFYSWGKIYGKVFYFWNGNKVELVVTEAELVKEILNNSASYTRTETDKYLRKLIGDGIIACEGQKWAKLRKLSNQAFHAENLKSMIPTMVESVDRMLQKWRKCETTQVDICEEFRVLTSEIISRAAFGSSYSQGEKVFQMLRKLSTIISRNEYKIKIPGRQVFKNQDDVESERIEEEIQQFFLDILNGRGREHEFGCDFLGSLLRARERNIISVQEIIDECKTFYSAGHGTTSNLLSWTALLLAIHPDWQQIARDEVIQVFGHHHPSSDGLPKLKKMGMIINESLRLYPPIAATERKSSEGAKLGSMTLPGGIKINIPTLALHHDPTIWGEDAHLFKPDRFCKGVGAATGNNPAAFSPFGMGSRMCVGMNFATNEAKIALCMLLQRYNFSLSPKYVHSPVQIVILRPQYGVQLMLQSRSP